MSELSEFADQEADELSLLFFIDVGYLAIYFTRRG
jgi:hypothetical protein